MAAECLNIVLDLHFLCVTEFSESSRFWLASEGTLVQVHGVIIMLPTDYKLERDPGIQQRKIKRSV